MGRALGQWQEGSEMGIAGTFPRMDFPIFFSRSRALSLCTSRATAEGLGRWRRDGLRRFHFSTQTCRRDRGPEFIGQGMRGRDAGAITSRRPLLLHEPGWQDAGSKP